ncbi:MAG: hypothetical protein K2N91_04530, partial [Muribaculaceae bacterium]|nr:hypothetical protein [Muribaculaceae bacterium]
KKTYKDTSQFFVIVVCSVLSLFFFLFCVYSVLSLIFPEIIEVSRPSPMPEDILYSDFLGLNCEFGDEYFSDYITKAGFCFCLGGLFLYNAYKGEREYRNKCEQNSAQKGNRASFYVAQTFFLNKNKNYITMTILKIVIIFFAIGLIGGLINRNHNSRISENEFKENGFGEKEVAEAQISVEGWVNLGPVIFHNEFDLESFDDVDECSDILIDGNNNSYDDYLEKQKNNESIKSRLRQMFYLTRSMNEQPAVGLYSKGQNGRTIFSIINSRTGESWNVEIGSFVTEIGQSYNARIMISLDDYKASIPLYFNI